jgi:hypothetical protein
MADTTPDVTPTPARTLAALRELVRALDRRVPQVERAGELRIARDAQLLRHEALTRIEELQRESAGGGPPNPVEGPFPVR